MDNIIPGAEYMAALIPSENFKGRVRGIPCLYKGSSAALACSFLFIFSLF
jgi:hypothetical protein